MRKLLFIAAAVGSLAVPAMAEEVGVGVGPVGVGVTVETKTIIHHDD